MCSYVRQLIQDSPRQEQSDFDPRRSKQNTSYISRLIWQNTGFTCLIGLLVFPIVVGLAIGYLAVLAGVAGYRKIQGNHKNKSDKNKDGYQKIKVVLGEELVESSFPDTVSLNVQDGGHDRSNGVPKKYYNHRLVNQNTNNGYVKTYRLQDGMDSGDDNTHALNQEYRSAEESDCSSLHASTEDNVDKTEDEEHERKRTNQRRSHKNKPKNTYQSPNRLNSVERDKLLSPDCLDNGTLGRLRFALHYNTSTNELQVNIIKAANLPILDNKEGVNPYVKICLLPQQFCWQRTKIIENNPDPVFNESFVISGFSKQRIDDYILRFCVVNYHDHFKDKYADDVLGEIHFPLSALSTIDNKPMSSITKWMNLQTVVSRKFEPEDLGDICVSLCYRPISGRFIVTLTKVRGLPKVLLERTDPYIKISLYCDGIRISKANTRVKRKTLNPIYNEKFNFNVTSDQISLATVVLKVVNHYDVTHGGGGGGLGQVILGYNSQGSGQEHWNSMVESPSRHVEKWHKIYKDNSL